MLPKVDSHGAVSFAGTGYQVGNRYRGTVGVRIVGDTIQITQDGTLLASTWPDTTQIRSSEPGPVHETNHEELRVSHRNRSQDHTVVPNLYRLIHG